MYNIAIIGASGLVGESLISLLDKCPQPNNYLLFGKSSIGRHITIQHTRYTILDIDTIHNYSLDYALFMTDATISSRYIPSLVDNNTICIDNSSYYRLHDTVPLVVPGINNNSITQHKGIIANANCTTIQLACVLHALKPLNIQRVVCSTYQAVSGAGRQALDDWSNCAQYGSLRAFIHPICDNVIPHIDDFDNMGNTREELKVINESRKILDMPDLPISCMAVRVPVSCGHGISANIETSTPYDTDVICNLLQQSNNITLYDNTSSNIYPMPIVARGTHNVYVGRIHQDTSKHNTINCFIVADNLIRGASYNALQILQLLLGERS